MCKGSPGAIKNLMQIVMIKLHTVLCLSEGFHNGTKLAFDPFVVVIYLLMKTEKKLSGV